MSLNEMHPKSKVSLPDKMLTLTVESEEELFLGVL